MTGDLFNHLWPTSDRTSLRVDEAARLARRIRCNAKRFATSWQRRLNASETITKALIALVLTVISPIDSRADGMPQALEKSRLLVASGERRFEFQVELAEEPEERRIGLMYRRELAADQGMLFDFGQSSPVLMWMRNTYVPLDMLFIRANGDIVNIAHDTVPQSEAILTSEGPVRAVLELPGGTSRLLGIQPGDRVLHPVLGTTVD